MDDSFSLDNVNGINHAVAIPSEPPGLNSRSADDLNSRQSSSVVDCCVELDNDNEIAAVVAAVPISNVPKEAIVDPLHGENASGQVKPRSESSRLDYRVSSADECDDGIAHSIPSKPHGLGSCHFRSADCVFKYDDGIAASGLGSCHFRSADYVFECNDGIAASILSESPAGLGSHLSATVCQDSWGAVKEDPSEPLADDLFEQHVGIDSRPSALAADLNSRQSSSVVDCCLEIDNDNGIAVVVAAVPISKVPKEAILDPLHGENASGQVQPRSESS